MAKQTKKTDSVPPPAVVEEQPAALATTQPGGALAVDYGDDMGMGLEDAGKGLVPWYSLFQSNSPQVEQSLIPGAAAGQLFNAATGELIDAEVGPNDDIESKGLLVQLVYIKRVWVEWIPREKGGGVAARYSFDKSDGFDPYIVDQIAKNKGSEIFDKKNPMPGKVDPQNSVIDTKYVYFNVLTTDGKEVESQGVMACSSSKIKPVDQVIGAVNNAKNKPSLFAVLFRLTTWQDKQKKPPQKVFKNIRFTTYNPYTGKTGGRIVPDVYLPQSHDLYQQGRDLYFQLKAGDRKADFDKEATVADRSEAEDAAEKRDF